jgi:hypothetical protein
VLKLPGRLKKTDLSCGNADRRELNVQSNVPLRTDRRATSAQHSGRGRAMTALVFTCPRTGHDVVSGINTDWASLSRVQQLPVTIFCPHCGKVHRLAARDGRFAETPLPPEKTATSH